MSLVGFKAKNHPQQVAVRGATDRDELATSWEVFDPLNERFGFTLDVAASAANAKCKRFLSVEQSGLTTCWAGERVWCNPPFSDIEPWVQHAWDCWTGAIVGHRKCAELIVMLLPANRTEQGWWQRYVEPFLRVGYHRFHVEFLPGRIRFIAPGKDAVGPNERPPFGCCLLIWT